MNLIVSRNLRRFIKVLVGSVSPQNKNEIAFLHASPPPPLAADGQSLCDCPTPEPVGPVPTGDLRQWWRLANYDSLDGPHPSHVFLVAKDCLRIAAKYLLKVIGWISCFVAFHATTNNSWIRK